MRVVHCKKEPYDTYIGRPSKWGNPFTIGRDGSRSDVVAKYKNYLTSRPDLLKQIPALKGKTLGCWCSPKPCHGDVLMELANKPTTDSTMPFKCPTEPAGAFKLESGTTLPCETNRSPGAS